MNLQELLPVTEDFVLRVKQRMADEATVNTLKNIRKEYWKRDRVVSDVTENIVLLLNPSNESDGEHESGDTENRSACWSGEVADLDLAQSQ
jgi:hypothetical protein